MYFNLYTNLNWTSETLTSYPSDCEEKTGKSTCFGVYREVWLAVENAVHDSGAVSVGGVVCVGGCHLRHVRPCGAEAQDLLMLL